MDRSPGSGVVMMGGLGPAPFCGMLLGDLGADVVRVDRVTEVDQPPPIDTVMRRSQRSIAVDMKHPQGREIVHALTADADAFVDVYRPGAAERLGIGPVDLLDRNPRLVYARMTGWVRTGRTRRWQATTSTTSPSRALSTRSASPRRRCPRSISSVTTAAAACSSRSGCSAASSSPASRASAKSSTSPCSMARPCS